ERRKLRQLSQFVKDLGINVGKIESRFEIQAVLDKVENTPLKNGVTYAVLKSMNKAVYAPQKDGHYALDMEHYCHFTSPIRRYPDLTVHRLVQKLLEGKRTPDDPFPVLVNLGHHCSDMERNAAQAERELIELKLLHFMKRRVGKPLEAIVSRVYPDGLHARCVGLPVDGFIPVTTLPKDKYRYERTGQMLIGFKDGNRFRLGDQLAVTIAKVDLQERQLYLTVEKNLSAGKGSPPAAKKEKPKGKYSDKKMRERREKKKRKKRKGT
ncbi:MAG: RNB domain-containing ribonuclease, partial [Pirellulaceae bacterium]